MSDYRDRMVTEANELRTKMNALDAFIQGPIYDNLEPAEKRRMAVQYGFMWSYHDVLSRRIELSNDLTA